MVVDRRHPARLASEPLEVAVVIDVLRATSTAAVLLSRGAPGVVVVASTEQLSLLAAEWGPYLYVSEFSRLAGHGDRIDNSPVQAGQVEFAGRTPVLITTNGTRALDAAARLARQVLTASFLNLSAVAHYLDRLAPDRVTLLPAGDFEKGETRAEDEACADALEQLLNGGKPGLSALANGCRGDPRIQKRLLREPSFAADLDVCLSPDRFPVVPRYAHSGAGFGWLRIG